MERLTTKNIAGVAVYKHPFECERCGETIWRLPDYGDGSPTEKLADYEDAEEQGLLLRLPCPIGTTVYNTTWWDDVQEKVKVDGKTFYRTIHKHKVSKSTFSLLDIYDFGKTVFLTKAEAEKKLKEIGGENEIDRRRNVEEMVIRQRRKSI